MKHIRTLTQVLATSGLGTFLLTGCDTHPQCKDLSIAPQSTIEECKQHHSHVVPYAVYSGFFSPSSTVSESTGG